MRSISRFEVGSIPAKPQTFQFYDEEGNNANLTVYTAYEVELLGSNNELVNLDGIELRVDDAVNGRITVVWPRRNNVFSETGMYVLRFKFSGYGAIDFSESHEIKVTNFGRVNN